MQDVGFKLFFIVLISILTLPGCTSRSSQGGSGRIILVALDGADWDVIDPLLEEGALPHFETMIETGTRADLLSLDDEWVFLPEQKKYGTSPAIWTSIATGKLPEEHGIVDFVVRDGGITFPITSNYLTATPVWEIFGERDLQVAVAGYLARKAS
jgi:predicted AlkP superfamily phosphohydrolase/phosphomutase